MARDDPQFNLRMSQVLKDKIAVRAKENGRSLNAEIVQILEDSVSDQGDDLHTADVHELRGMLKIQAELLEKYSSAISEGTELLREVNQRNKKPT